MTSLITLLLKEGSKDMFYLMMHVLNIFYLQLYGVRHMAKEDSDSERKEMFYLTMHSTHFIYGYMASDIWQRTTQIASGRKCFI